MTRHTVEAWPRSGFSVEQPCGNAAREIDGLQPYLIAPRIVWYNGRALGKLVNLEIISRTVRQWNETLHIREDVYEQGAKITYDDKCVIDGKVYLSIGD